MAGSNWPALIRQIPESMHDTVALTLVNGTEIVLQRLLRLTDEFVVVLGRISGTTDGVRIAIIPYAQLVSVSLMTKVVKDDEIEAIFGQNNLPPLPAAQPQPHPSIADPPTPDPEEGLPPPEPAPKVALPSKQLLLAKLRARLGNGDK